MFKKIFFIAMLFMVLFFTVGTAKSYAAAIYDHEVMFDMNGGDYLHQELKNTTDTLSSGVLPYTMLNIGDSTSTGTSDWYYLFAERLANDIPKYSVEYRSWNATTNNYDTKTNFQYGSAGDAYAEFDGLSGSYISALDSNKLSITGDIDLRAKVLVEPGKSGSVISKWEGAGYYSYFLYFQVDSLGTTASMQLFWSEDGTNSINHSSSSFTVTKDKEIWIRATLDVDNGTGGYTPSFYYRYDDASYVLINAPVFATGITSIYDSSSSLEIGSRSKGTTSLFTGKIYEVEIRDGINGEIVASGNLDQAFPSTVPSFKDVEGNTYVIHGNVTVGNGSPGLIFLNASIAGSKISSFNSTLLDNLVDIDIDFLSINLGHNEDLNDTYVVQLENFIDSVMVYTGDVPVLLTTQNAQAAPRTTAQITAQNVRMDQVKLVAARNNYILVDAGASLDTDQISYLSADGVHPTVPGYSVWADKIADAFGYGFANRGYSDLSYLVEDGELIIAPDEPTKEGATFLGWYTNSSLTDEWDFESDLVQDDMVLYAKWSDSVAPITGGIISSPDGTTLAILGIAWYWWLVGGAFLYFGFTKKGRKYLGFKK